MDRVYYLGYVLLLLMVKTVSCSNDCGKLSLEYIQTGETVSAKIYFNHSADLEWYTWRRLTPLRHDLKNSTKYVISENPHTIIIKNLDSTDDGGYDTACTLTNGNSDVSANFISISLDIMYTTLVDTSRDSVSSRDQYSTTRVFETRITEGNEFSKTTPSSTERMPKTTEITILQYTGLFATTRIEPDSRTPLSYTSETVSSEGGTLSSSTETVSSEGGKLSSSIETVSSEEGTLSFSIETVSSEGLTLSFSTETVSSQGASSEGVSLSFSRELEISTLPYTKEASSQDVTMSISSSEVSSELSTLSTTDSISISTGHETDKSCVIEETGQATNILLGFFITIGLIIIIILIVMIYRKRKFREESSPGDISLTDHRNENMEQRNCFTNATYVTVEKETTSLDAGLKSERKVFSRRKRRDDYDNVDPNFGLPV